MPGNQNIQPHVVSATLVANDVDLAVLTDGGFGIVVENVTGTAPIWFTVSQPGGANKPPTVGGTGCFCVASVAGAQFPVRHNGNFGSCVQLISTGTPTYTVSVVGNQANM